MIVLNVGTNSVYFTLNEKFDFYSPSVSSYTQSYYVGKLINKLTESEVYFRLNNDTSTATQRYNRFSLAVTPNNVVSSNQIGLTGSNWDFDSQWNYEIWAVSGSTSSFTFSSIPNGGVILESGRAFLSSEILEPEPEPPTPPPTPEPSDANWTSVYLELDPQYSFATTITDIGPYGGQVYSLYLFNGGMTFSDWQTDFGPTVENENPPIYGVIPDRVWMSEDEAFAILMKQWIVAETDNIFYLITFEPHNGGGYDLYYHGELDSPCGIGSFDLSTSPLFDTFIISGTCV